METTNLSGSAHKAPIVCNHGKQFGYDNWYTFHCPACMGVVYGQASQCSCGQLLKWENAN